MGANAPGGGQRVEAASFPIQRQVSGDACIAAAACSLMDWLGVRPPAQARLDPCIQEGMRRGRSGFDALRGCLAGIGGPCVAARYTPGAAELVDWLRETPAARAGFLISHHVRVGGRLGAHVTVVFLAEGGWYRADPDGGTVRPVRLEDLARGYAGDVALLMAERGALRAVPEIEREVVEEGDSSDGGLKVACAPAVVPEDAPVLQASEDVLDFGASLAVVAPGSSPDHALWFTVDPPLTGIASH